MFKITILPFNPWKTTVFEILRFKKSHKVSKGQPFDFFEHVGVYQFTHNKSFLLSRNISFKTTSTEITFSLMDVYIRRTVCPMKYVKFFLVRTEFS